MRPLDIHLGRRALDTIGSVAELDAYAAGLETADGPLLTLEEIEAMGNRRRELLAQELAAQKAEHLRRRGRGAPL